MTRALWAAPQATLLALALAGAALAQDCYKYHGCTECVVQPHCGWCPTAASCWPGSAAGPTNPAQRCGMEDWNFGTCNAIRLQDGQRVSVKDPQGGFYEYFDFSLLYEGQDVTVVVDNGGVVSNRRLFASQTVSLPRSNSHEWEGKVKGSLIELRLGRADGVDYSKPLFLSVLNDVSMPYSIVAQMVPPSSGGELMSCSFDVSNTTFPAALSLRATSAIAEVCSKTSKSGDAFLQRVINGPSPLSEWDPVATVALVVYKGLFKYSENLTKPDGRATLRLSASGPYPYQGPRVLTVWRRRLDSRPLSESAAPSRTAPTLPAAGLPLPRAGCSSNPGWVVEGHSSSLDEHTRFWITTVYNQYLCGVADRPESWDWVLARNVGVFDDYWAVWSPFQTQSGFRWEVNGAVALDSPDVHWVWVSQSARPDNGRPYLFVVLSSVPVVPAGFAATA